jgi:hypothetical protein
MWKNCIADTFRQIFHRTASLSILSFVADAIKEKREKLVNGEVKAGDKADGRKDFLTKYIELQENNPEIPPW